MTIGRSTAAGVEMQKVGADLAQIYDVFGLILRSVMFSMRRFFANVRPMARSRL